MKKIICASVMMISPLLAHAADAGGYVFGNIASMANIWDLDARKAQQYGVMDLTSNKDGNAAAGAWELGAGYRFGDHLAAEASFMKGLGETRIDKAGAMRNQALRFAVLGLLPLSDSFDLYGKVSANYIYSDFRSANPGYASVKDKGWGIGLGLGAAYHLNKSLSLRAELDGIGQVKVKGVTDKSRLGSFKLGASYRL
ncbi:porin family protein [Chromobacterium violaceum]|uniref:porin family protein n=1 Tax=Chromobacterium violaceum TaxID=536 RepID=UPI001BEC0E81|nr:porin family protein [Chromobacterium violaceum]MBT2869831.1 porin family protein [Chromobacterium violaceum]